MNINRVYLCDVCKVCGKNEDGSYRCYPVKKSVVYHYQKYSDKWIDLESKETYQMGLNDIRKLFIREETLVPITSVIETKKDNMPKRKILKMYKNINGGK